MPPHAFNISIAFLLSTVHAIAFRNRRSDQCVCNPNLRNGPVIKNEMRGFVFAAVQLAHNNFSKNHVNFILRFDMSLFKELTKSINKLTCEWSESY